MKRLFIVILMLFLKFLGLGRHIITFCFDLAPCKLVSETEILKTSLQNGFTHSIPLSGVNSSINLLCYQSIRPWKRKPKNLLNTKF